MLHHTAVPMSRIGGRSLAAESEHMRAIQRWHLERGWATIGYHFVISPTGRIFLGRPVDRLGAHVLGHNAGTVGICLMGNFEQDRPTAASLASLEHTCARLVPGGSRVALRGHRQHRGHERSACPGQNLTAYLRQREEPPPGGSPRTPAAVD